MSIESCYPTSPLDAKGFFLRVLICRREGDHSKHQQSFFAANYLMMPFSEIKLGFLGLVCVFCALCGGNLFYKNKPRCYPQQRMGNIASKENRPRTSFSNLPIICHYTSTT